MIDRDEILAAFEALAELLASRGVEGRVFVVGGAAMVLTFGARRATRDIDAIFEPKAQVYSAAVEVASRLGLPVDWLNDAVKGFVPGTDPEAVPVFERPGLSVSSASARYMLAMKILAARAEQDVDDIQFLAGLLGLQTDAEVLAVASDRYAEVDLPPRARLLVEELFSSGPGEI